MIHLYVKQHNQTGLKYFGRTYRDPYKYNGSGKHWKRHLDLHGKDITTVSVWSFDENTQLQECIDFAANFSRENKIVDDVVWANLVEENVVRGNKPDTITGYAWSPQTREKMQEVWKTRGPASEHKKAKLRAANLGKKHSLETIEKLKHNNDGRVLSEKQLHVLHTSRLKPENEEKRLAALRKVNVGKQRPESVKRAIRQAKTGTEFTTDHRAKLSKAAKARVADGIDPLLPYKYQKGHKRTPESVAKGLETKQRNKSCQ